jgi:hypothetical protein
LSEDSFCGCHKPNYPEITGALGVGAAMAAQPAAWAVRYAVRSPQGGPLVAYWAALLAAGLPAMHAVAAARHVPIILIRKVQLVSSHANCC